MVSSDLRLMLLNQGSDSYRIIADEPYRSNYVDLRRCCDRPVLAVRLVEQEINGSTYQLAMSLRRVSKFSLWQAISASLGN